MKTTKAPRTIEPVGQVISSVELKMTDDATARQNKHQTLVSDLSRAMRVCYLTNGGEIRIICLPNN